MKDFFGKIKDLKNFKSLKSLKIKLIIFGIGFLLLFIFLLIAYFFFDFSDSGSSKPSGNGEYDKYEPGKGVCNLIVPLKANYSVTSLYGYRVPRAARGSSFHNGIDLGVSSGSDVYAAFSGIVTTGYGDLSGYYLRIKNESGEVVKYFHLSKILVKSGQTVEQGEVVAKSGSTGASSGPHLHFEFVDASGKTVSLNNMFGYTDLEGCINNTGTKSEAERKKCNISDSRKMSELEKTQFKNACAGVSTPTDDDSTTPDETGENEEIEETEKIEDETVEGTEETTAEETTDEDTSETE